jgi:hypothetical protein
MGNDAFDTVALMMGSMKCSCVAETRHTAHQQQISKLWTHACRAKGRPLPQTEVCDVQDRAEDGEPVYMSVLSGPFRSTADKSSLPDCEGPPDLALHERRIGKGAARTVLSSEQGRWKATGTRSGALPTRGPRSRRRRAAAVLSGEITAYGPRGVVCARPRHACPCCGLTVAVVPRRPLKSACAHVALLLGVLTAVGGNALLCSGLQPAVPAGLDAVVRDVHDLWRKKRPYFLASELEWTPKYAEEDVGITAYMRNNERSADSAKCRGRSPHGIIKALWHDFVVEEVRLSDGSLVCLPAGTPTLRPDANTSRATEERRYVKFVLALLGIDTIAAVRRLADYCRVPYSAFRFAGIKDKYGITIQEVTADTSMVASERLLTATASESSPLYPQMRIGSAEKCSEHLHSGELQGNRFTITVRNVSMDADDLDAALHSLQHAGFVNYFGLQVRQNRPTSPIKEPYIC